MLVQGSLQATRTRTTMSNLLIDQNRKQPHARQQQNNDAFGQAKESTTCTLGPLGLQVSSRM